MPSVAFSPDWVRAVMLASRPLAMARPAASSEPELIFYPEDRAVRVLFREACV
jgi:hypothetical protein